MRKYNKYGAANKNVRKIDSEIVTEYKGKKVPDDILMIRMYDKKNECYVSFVPNFADKVIGLSVNQDNEFSDRVIEYLANSGIAEKIMKEIYVAVWGNQQPTTTIQGTFSSPIQQPLTLPKLNLPKLNKN